MLFPPLESPPPPTHPPRPAGNCRILATPVALRQLQRLKVLSTELLQPMRRNRRQHLACSSSVPLPLRCRPISTSPASPVCRFRTSPSSSSLPAPPSPPSLRSFGGRNPRLNFLERDVFAREARRRARGRGPDHVRGERRGLSRTVAISSVKSFLVTQRNERGRGLGSKGSGSGIRA